LVPSPSEPQVVAGDLIDGSLVWNSFAFAGKSGKLAVCDRTTEAIIFLSEEQNFRKENL
jgi:hypothetical protein